MYKENKNLGKQKKKLGINSQLISTYNSLIPVRPLKK